MAKYLICQICGEKLPFNPDCPCCLGEHLLQKHPKLPMVHFSHEDLLCNCDSTHAGPKRSLTMCAKKKRNTVVTKKTASQPRIFFKTTVETWKQGPLKLKCPNCNVMDRPCIRKQRNRVARSHFGALLLLGCWPICFLPCLTSSGNIMDLYCKHCGTYLGQYDRKTGILKCPCPGGDKKGAEVPKIC